MVGELQFEVFEHRLKSEYKVDIRVNRMSHQFPRWVTEDSPQKLPRMSDLVVKDESGNKVILFENEFSLNWAKKNNPDVKLYTLEQFYKLPSA